jgi:hypothetical protein
MQWLEVSDAVLVVQGFERSTGTRREIARAGQLGIPVHFSFEDLVSSGDSPQRPAIEAVRDLHTPGAKDDAAKPDASLLLDFSEALNQVAEVATYGAGKYSRGGWRKVSGGVRRYTAAMLRHLFAEHQEFYDAETNLPHAAHAAWNALARLELMSDAN